jgi:hypothetical protein
MNSSRLENREITMYDTIINRFGRLVPFNREEILLRAARIILTD